MPTPHTSATREAMKINGVFLVWCGREVYNFPMKSTIRAPHLALNASLFSLMNFERPRTYGDKNEQVN